MTPVGDDLDRGTELCTINVVYMHKHMVAIFNIIIVILEGQYSLSTIPFK